MIALSVTFGDSSPKGGNDDDRRQRRKQGGVVGAAASRMQARAKQTLGAATRVRSTLGMPGRPTQDEKSLRCRKMPGPAAKDRMKKRIMR